MLKSLDTFVTVFFWVLSDVMLGSSWTSGLGLAQVWMPFFFLWVPFLWLKQHSFCVCYEAATDRMCSITDSGAEYSQTNGVQPFRFSTESQQAACLKPIKSTTSVSLLILKSDVKTYKWQRFMSEVHRLLFVLAVQRFLYGVYFNSDAALRLDTVRKHETHAGYAGTGCLHQATFWWPSC